MAARSHFSAVAGGYARHRPSYPAALFRWLAGLVPGARRIWDCGAGSGQATRGLTGIAPVIMTDVSVPQLRLAAPHGAVRRWAAEAGASALRDDSMDLVTVAQALHWFDRDSFFREVTRVLRPGGVVAAWTYGGLTVAPAVDPALHVVMREILGRYWPPPRVMVDDLYRHLVFPFDEISAPAFRMEASWTLEDLLGYIATWSATQEYRDATGEDPMPAVRRVLEPVWPVAGVSTVRWPLAVRAGRVP